MAHWVLWQWIGAYGAIATGCFCLLLLTIPKVAGEFRQYPSLTNRLAMIVAALLLIIVVGHDLQQRRSTAMNGANVAGAPRGLLGDAALQMADSSGPAVVIPIIRHDHSWTRVQNVQTSSDCPGDNGLFQNGFSACCAAIKPWRSARA